MDSKEYVLNHDFGYGREPELENLNKLELRNIEDLKVYIDDVMNNAFINYTSFILSFNDDKLKIIIEEL